MCSRISSNFATLLPRDCLIPLKAQPAGFPKCDCSPNYIFLFLFYKHLYMFLLKLRDGLNLHLWGKCFKRWLCNYTTIQSPKIQPLTNVLMVSLCQSKNQVYPFIGHAQVTGSSTAEHGTRPLVRREVSWVLPRRWLLEAIGKDLSKLPACL